MDEEEVELGKLNVLGYFALSTKVLHLPEDLTNSQRKKIDGLYTNISEISTFLIGQLAKNDLNKNRISGDEILQYAFDYISEASEIVGGRIILVELKDNEFLKTFYSKNKFFILQNKTENEENLLQMIRVLGK